VVAADAVDAPAGVPVTELADHPLAILRGIGAANASALGAALDASTVRDLALWPPHAAARSILDLAYFPEREPGFDPDAPADLLPKSGVYPTERVFYRKLLLDTIAEPAPLRGVRDQEVETGRPVGVLDETERLDVVGRPRLERRATLETVHEMRDDPVEARLVARVRIVALGA
jgi:hypothetical protein